MAVVDRSIGAFLLKGARISLTRPGQARQFVRTARWQSAAAKTRAQWQKRGVRVPPIVIFSITQQCNLRCVGCYAQVFQGAPDTDGRIVSEPRAGVGVEGCGGQRVELSDARLGGVVAEAERLGVSFFVIAGGEPLMRPEILAIAERFPRVLFLLFTNGLLLDDMTASEVSRLKNVIPLVSLEGTAVETDARRGVGTHEQLLPAMARLKERRVFFGCSLTLTSIDFATVLEDAYVAGLVAAGCRFFLYADYTPVDEATRDWALTDTQRAQVTSRMASLRQRYPALFVAVPWDEREVGGCLSAGKGFVHINAVGDVEPCPFAPFSDANVTEVALAEALRSPFLQRLREMPELSEYTGGGCALWKNRPQVEKVLAETRRR